MLLLFLLLLVYALSKFYFIWKKNYRMPEGVSYFEEKKIEEFEGEVVTICRQSVLILVTVPARSRDQSMSFMPWRDIKVILFT